MDEIIINKIEWSAKEYEYKERSNDFLWTIGLGAIALCAFAIWISNYLFAIFILISGASLILFSIRHPRDVEYIIETSGFTIGKEKYDWKKVKYFDIKKEEDKSILIIELDKHMFPVFSVPLPVEVLDQVKEEISKVVEHKELQEPAAIKFMERIGF